jgi:hypothetical protein
MGVVPVSFISRTASTASPATSCVFGHARGSFKVVEKTIFGRPARASVPGSPPLASSDMSRYVFAPIKMVELASG